MSDEARDSRDELLTPVDLAKLLKVKVVTVHAAAARGDIPVTRLWAGKRRSLVRFRRSEIDRWLESRRQRADEVTR